MRNIGLMFAAAALTIATPASAVVVNYQFGGVGSGNMALDLTGGAYTLSALNLTLGTANFTSGNSAMQLDGGGPDYLLGSTAVCGPGCAGSNFSSFYLFFDPGLSFQTPSVFSWSQGDGNLHSNDTVTITKSAAAAAVPEPASWAMMLLGFAGIAATVRWRRRQGATALA